MNEPHQLDEVTKQHISDALWMDNYDESKLPSNIKKAVASDKNSEHGIGERMRQYLLWLEQHPQSHNPDYSKRYKALREAITTLTPQQAYVISSKYLGNNAVQGYDMMPSSANLEFPRDHQPKLRSQVGWHFFVGSTWDESGQEWGIEMMFFRVALLPPELAARLGLSDIENQVMELQLGISKAGDRHHQADPVLVAGTSGLININAKPFSYQIGKNNITSLSKDKFFPMRLQCQGFDRGGSKPFELGIDLEFTEGKETLFQGDDGCMPCVAGMGTLYYSIPNVVLKAGSTINYGGKKVTLKKGTFWFDHQWGFLSGNPNSDVLRAANNISTPAPAGWDWYMAQFVGNRQITMFAPHGKAYSKYYFQTGDQPPEMMKIDVAGKYMDEQKGLHTTWGTLIIDEWVKSNGSPNPMLYPVTNTWHPNRWHFSFDNTMPADIREFTMTQIVPEAQTNFFANASQYNEGAVYLRDRDGNDIGRGFAEAVQYADTTDNMYKLAGFENNPKLRRILASKGASLPKRLSSFIYMITHQKALKQVMATAKGLEFFSKPKKSPPARH
jgi:predicted secreted hydrolase